MIETLMRKIRRCREEGLKQSIKIAAFQLKRPFKKRYLRHKYLNYSPTALPRNGHFNSGKFFFEKNQWQDWSETFKQLFPEALEVTLQTAESVCEHRFDWLCPNCPTFDGRVEWFSSFNDGNSWPCDFYQDLDYSGEQRPGDVRQVWELNRHQHFVLLGRAYLLTGDSRYAEEFLDQLLDWIEHNPLGYGINWLHSQEVAIRALSWAWSYYFFNDYPGFDVAKKDLFLKSLHAHADYILWHLSDRPVTHNHLISEACGLAALGILFPQLRGARRWRQRGLSIFERELLKQVWEDGLDGELSTNYHCFVLDSFLHLFVLMKINSIPVSDLVAGRIESMIEATMFMLRPDGSLPLIGDNDSGRAFRLTEYSANNRCGYLAIGAVLFERGDFKHVSRAFNDEAFWLLGTAGKKAYDNIVSKEPDSRDKAFVPGGLITSRSSWDKKASFLIVRCGPTQLRKGVSISHNHADLLSFELTVAGHRVLVDPGVYLYGESDPWRYFFRQSLAHNTLVIDHQDHFDVTSTRFGIASLPLSKLYGFEHNDQFMFCDIAHTGYSRLGMIHRRKLLWSKDHHLLIVDHLLGEGVHRVDSYFHFSPEVQLSKQERGVNVQTKADKVICSLSSVSCDPDVITIVEGQTTPIQGWFAGRYGVKHPAPVAKLSKEVQFPHTLVTFINMCPEDISEVCLKQCTPEGCSLLIEVNGHVESIEFPATGGVVFNDATQNSRTVSS